MDLIPQHPKLKWQGVFKDFWNILAGSNLCSGPGQALAVCIPSPSLQGASVKAAEQSLLCIDYSFSSSQYRSVLSAKWIIIACLILRPTSTWLWPVCLSSSGGWHNVNDGNFWLLTGGMEIWMRMAYVFIYLNTWFPVGGTAWEELGGVKEVVMGFEFSKAHAITSWLSRPHGCLKMWTLTYCSHRDGHGLYPLKL